MPNSATYEKILSKVLSKEHLRLFTEVDARILSTAPLPPMFLIQTCFYRTGCSTPYHSTDYSHAILSLSGHAVFQEKGKAAFDCVPGVFFVIPPGVPYMWRSESDALLFQCQHKPFTFLEHRTLAQLFGTSQRRISYFTLDPEDFKSFKLRLEKDMAKEEPERGLMLSTDMLRIMASAASLAKAGDRSEHPALIKAIAYLEENVCREVTLEELAKHAGLGSSRLSQLFREEVGKSPMQYMAMLKAERATALLLVDGLSSCEVAERLGFSSDSYFRRFYKLQTGDTPGRVRNRKNGYAIAI